MLCVTVVTWGGSGVCSFFSPLLAGFIIILALIVGHTREVTSKVMACNYWSGVCYSFFITLDFTCELINQSSLANNN